MNQAEQAQPDAITAQEIFNRVWQRFVVEKAPRSLSASGGVCMYRGVNGAACAVGCLLSDEEAARFPEGESVASNRENLPARFRGHLGLLEQLQEAHDVSTGTFVSETELRIVADNFDLAIPEVAS
jgi:hypothetical protein